MALHPLDWHWPGRTLFGIGFVTAAAMVWGGATGRAVLVTAAAGCFALAATVVAVLCNREVWRARPPADADANVIATHGTLAGNALLSATVYGWGALAMQGLYLTPVTGLKWQHGWQYALAMALLGAGWLALARRMRLDGGGIPPSRSSVHSRWAFALSLAQGLIAAVGLASLIVSGKLWSVRSDWAANRVFAALAVAILAVSVLSGLSQARSRGETAPRGGRPR